MQTLRARLLVLLNAQTAPTAVAAWCDSLKQSLEQLIPAVDRISVNVNRAATIGASEFHKQHVAALSTFDRNTSEHSLIITSGNVRDARYFVDCFRRSGFPVEDYRLPSCLNYHGVGGVYLGSVLLWQRVASPTIDQSTLQLMEDLRSLMTYLFVGAILRFQVFHFHYSRALRTASRLLEAAGLTRREREIFLYRFQGYSVGATAQCLNLSEATVRRHIRSIRAQLRDHQAISERVLGVPFVELLELDENVDR